MKQRIDILIEEEIIRLARRRAMKEGRSASELIRNALKQYLQERAATPEKRKLAYQLFCEQPMKISREQFRKLLEKDVGDQ